MLKFSFEDFDSRNSYSNIVILLDQDLKLSPNAMLIDQKYHGIISKTIKQKDLFSGKFNSLKTLVGTDKDGNLSHIVLIGIGDRSILNDSKKESIGGKIYGSLNALKIQEASVLCDDFESHFLASGAKLASYSFNHYFTKDREEKESKLQNIKILTKNSKDAESHFIHYELIAKGVFFARDLISEPPNVLFPESYAQKIVSELEPLDVEVEVLGEREMELLGMGALLGVGQGSTRESKLVVMRYIGLEDEDISPVAFVGKGVTFDSGGISIKPAAGMEDMKYDMAGSAAVVGLIKTLALRKAKVNAIGVIGLVENMPGGNAQRPSDVVKSMSGQTVEVLNTDAEGRLVLGDALWYTQEKFNPKFVVNLATLTGAITVALGKNLYAGLFSNDSELSDKLVKSGSLVDEKLWPFPMDEEYDKLINSDIADMKNIGDGGGAGSITAAQFLKRFIKKGMPWAHLDIAGVAWNKKGSNISPKGAVGFGVRLLNKLIEEYYESK